MDLMLVLVIHSQQMLFGREKKKKKPINKIYLERSESIQ